MRRKAARSARTEDLLRGQWCVPAPQYGARTHPTRLDSDDVDRIAENDRLGPPRSGFVHRQGNDRPRNHQHLRISTGFQSGAVENSFRLNI